MSSDEKCSNQNVWHSFLHSRFYYFHIIQLKWRQILAWNNESQVLNVCKIWLDPFSSKNQWIFSLWSMSCAEVMRVWRREVRLVMRTQQMRLLSVRDSNQSKLTTLDTSFLEQPAIFSKLQIKTRASNETFPPLICARPRNFFSCCFCPGSVVLRFVKYLR